MSSAITYDTTLSTENLSSPIHNHHSINGSEVLTVSSETNDLQEKINKLRTNFANDNKKGLFSSKQFKFDCANTIVKNIELETLLDSTLIWLPNSNHLFFDYTIFKTYATPEIYDKIIKYVIDKIAGCINTYGSYEMHVNLNTFSVSAFHRYKAIIEGYSYECNTNHKEFHDKIRIMHVYNIPTTIETISQLVGPMLPQIVRQKVIRYDKSSSEKPLQTISEIIASM
jgi:hypothetical protein